MSVHRYETGDGTRYRVRWRDPTGKLHSRTLLSKRDAVALDTDIKAKKLRSEVLPQSSGWTVDQAWDEWWSVRGEELAPATQQSYRYSWGKHIAPSLGAYKLTALAADSRLIEAHFARLRRGGVGPSARRKAMMVMSAVFKACVQWGEIPLNPMRDMAKPAGTTERLARPFAPIAVERIRQRMWPTGDAEDQEGHANAAIVSVLAYAGLRPQEAWALRFSDIGGRGISVDKAIRFGEKGHPSLGPTKTGRARVVPLLKPLEADLKLWRKGAGLSGDDSLVFPSPAGAGPWSKATYGNWRRNCWRPALESVAESTPGSSEAILKSRPYDCRGSFVSLLLRAGTDPLLVSKWAGHSAQVMFRHYAAVIEDLEDETRTDAAEQIERARRAVAEETPARVSELIDESFKPANERSVTADDILYGTP